MSLSPLLQLRSPAALAAPVLLCLGGCGDEAAQPPDAPVVQSPRPMPPADPGPPAPRAGLGDAAVAAFLARPAGREDFVVKFGEPFLGFETRGKDMLVSDHTSGERYATIVPVERRRQGSGWAFSGTIENPWGERYDFAVTVEPGECDDEFSGEITDFKAGFTSPGRNRPHPGCARIVGEPQRWPGGFEP